MSVTNDELRRFDPVSEDLAIHTADPVFDELGDRLVGDASRRSRLPGSRGRNDARIKGRLGRRSAVALVAAAAVVAGIAVVSLGQSPSASSHRWRLDADLTAAWQVTSLVGSDPVSLECPSASTCYADDLQRGDPAYGQLEVTTDGGSSWHPSVPPVTAVDASALACVGVQACATLVVSASGHSTLLETSDGATNWASAAGPPGLDSPESTIAMTCTTLETCVVVASDPAGAPGTAGAFLTDDGGATWTDADVTPDFVPVSVQCSTDGVCVAAGSDAAPGGSADPPGAVLESTDGATTWTPADLPIALGPAASLSCADGSCAATFLGGAGRSGGVLTSADGGRSWSVANVTSALAVNLASLTCPSASACVAVLARDADFLVPGAPAPSGPAAGIATSEDDGQAWQLAQLPQGVVPLAVSCAAPDACIALAVSSSAAPSQTLVSLSDTAQPGDAPS